MLSRPALISIALMLTTLPSLAKDVFYAIIPQREFKEATATGKDYKALDRLMLTQKAPTFRAALASKNSTNSQVPQQRVLVISGGYKSIKDELSEFEDSQIKLQQTAQTGPATLRLQICYKKILTAKNMTYVAIGHARDYWDITPICSSTYDSQLTNPDLGIKALIGELDSAFAQR